MKRAIGLFVVFVVLAFSASCYSQNWWDIEYDCSVLPNQATPPWGHWGTGGITTVDNGILHIVDNSTLTENSWNINNLIRANYTYEIRLKIGSISNGSFLHAVYARPISGEGRNLIFSTNQVGLQSNSGEIYYTMNTTDKYHVYRVIGSLDSIYLFIDGYFALAFTNPGDGQAFFRWGAMGNNPVSDAYWDYIRIDTTDRIFPSSFQSMVAYWPLDEVSGDTVYDFSENSNNGIASNAEIVPGCIGSGTARQFGTSTKFIMIPNHPSINFSSDFSITAWIKLDSLPHAGGEGKIIFKCPSAGSSKRYEVSVGPDGKLYFNIADGNPVTNQVRSTQSLPIGSCIFITAVRQNSNLKLFINAIPDSVRSGVTTESQINNAQLYLGYRQTSSDQPFPGVIDEVRLFNYALSDSQIINIYSDNGRPNINCDNPLEYYYSPDSNTTGLWHFCEGIGSSSHDNSNHNQDAAIYGATWVPYGKYGNGLQFDNDSVVVSLSDQSFMSGPHTWEVWINPDTIGPQQAIMSMWNYNQQIPLFLKPSGKLSFRIVNPTNALDIESKSTLQAHQWYHVGGQWDGDTVSIIINGQIDTSMFLNYDPTVPTDNNIYLGKLAHSVNYSYFKGKIDEVRISNLARYHNVGSPAHILIDTLMVWDHGTQSLRIQNPSSTDSILITDRIRFYGHIVDQNGRVIPGASITAFNSFDYVYDTTYCIDTIMTDNNGVFIFPDTIEAPSGLLCPNADVFPFWFSASSDVAIPIMIQVLDNSMSMEAIADSLVEIYNAIFPDSLYAIGLPDTSDPLVVSFKPYPQNPTVLDDISNNKFFEGFVSCYHGPVDYSFLYDSTESDTNAWINRGARLSLKRVSSVVDTLHNYFNHNNRIRLLALKDQYGTWHNVASQNMVLVDWGEVWNYVSYGIEGFLCAASIIGTAGPGGLIGCVPLAFHFASDYAIRPYVIPWACDDVFKARDPNQCRAIGEVGIGVASIAIAGGVSGVTSSTSQHIRWIANPRNLFFGRPRAYAELVGDITDIATVGETSFNLGELSAEYNYHPLRNEVQAFGFDNYSYTPLVQGNLSGLNIGTYATMTTPAIQNIISPAYDNNSNPQCLNFTINSSKPYYSPGNITPIPPCITLSNTFGSLEVTNIVSDDDNYTYDVSVPISELQEHLGWQSSQTWNVMITSQGYDLVSNQCSEQCNGGYCPVSTSITITLSNNSFVNIPQNACTEPAFYSFTPYTALGTSGSPRKYPGNFTETTTAPSRFFGPAYRFSPTNLVFSLPVNVGISIAPNNVGSIGDSVLALARFDSTLDEWQICGTSLDTEQWVISGTTLKSGIFRIGVFPPGADCQYYLGDINSDGNRIGGDVTYGVRYFKSIGPQPPDSCFMDSTGTYLYVAGDVNGNCEFRGSDITRLVAYFKGTASLAYCHFFPTELPILRQAGLDIPINNEK